MRQSKKFRMSRIIVNAISLLIAVVYGLAHGQDLGEIKQRGVLRHLGVPYANFVTHIEHGFDVELIRLFAEHLGVRYEFVRTDWKQAFTDLTGKKFRLHGNEVEWLDSSAPVRGDLIASGLTVLPWRETIVDFSNPTFPTSVWLIARADSSLQPIKPSGDILQDIAEVKKNLEGRSVLGLELSCLDPSLYALERTGAKINLSEQTRTPDDMVPVMLNSVVESTLLDVPEALIALERWPGEIKIIGPISERQEMAVAFDKNASELRRAFNAFLRQKKQDGTYLRLVMKYYPMSAYYFKEYFSTLQAQMSPDQSRK
jgi:ABC-type amino acid transport substrate-binding protein